MLFSDRTTVVKKTTGLKNRNNDEHKHSLEILQQTKCVF